jgi:hypothetical protein
MALDPRIALGVQPVQIQSPLEMANQIAGLRAAEQRNAFTQMQMRQAERALTQENELRRRVSAPGFFKDPNALATLTGEFGAPGAELFAAYGQGRKAMTEADAATAKVANDNYGRFQKVIGDFAYGEETPTKDKVLSRVDMLIKQGIIAPEFGDYARNILPDDPKQLQASLQDQFLSQVPVEERARLFVPKSAAVQAQDLAKSSAGAARTTVQAFVPASETIQTEAMKELRDTFKQLKTAPVDIANLREAARLANTSARKYMGTGGKAFLEGAKFLKNRLGVDVDTSAIVNAETARTALFQNVLNNLRKLDAQPSQEQQRIMQEALGNLDTDPDALPSVVRVYEDVIRGRVEQHNKTVAETEASGIKSPYSLKIDLPEREVTLSPEDQEALNWANANPRDPRSTAIKQRLGM